MSTSPVHRLRPYHWIWAALITILAGWLLAADLVPSGRLEFTEVFVRRTSYVGTPLPQDRVRGPLDDSWWGRHVEIIAEPVYVDVRLPRLIRSLTWELDFHPGDAAVIELGVAHPARPQEVQLLPLYHRALEALGGDATWTVLAGGELRLYQRGTSTYPDVASFLRQPPELGRINRYRLPPTVLDQAAELPASGPPPGVDYVLTQYESTVLPNRRSASIPWRRSRRRFLLSAQLGQASQLRLVFSVPERNFFPQPPRLGASRVTLEGDPMNLRVLRQWLSRWFRPS